MKFLSTALVVVLMSNMALAQVWAPNVNTTDLVSREGNVIIGSNTAVINTTPMLQVKSKIVQPAMAPPGGTAAKFSLTGLDGQGSNSLSICNFSSSWGATLFEGKLDNQSVFKVFNDGATIIGPGSSPTKNMLTVTGGASIYGNVVIGNVTTPNTNYKLFVEKGILTEKLKVAVSTTANWSDYVFSKDYKLMPLEEVSLFVQKNKHLPGVPSAEEVVKEGIDMATMDAKLLEKIEELTLYLIEIKKENAEMKNLLEQRLLLLESK